MQIGNKFKYFYLTFFLAPLVFNPFGGANPYEMAKQSFLFLIIGIFLLLVIVKLLFGRGAKIFFNKTVFLIFSLWILSFALSTIFSLAPIESFWGTYDRLQGFLTSAYYGIHFLICLQLFRDEKFTRAFFAVTILAGVFVSVYAVMQKFFPDADKWFFEGLFAKRPYSTIGSPTGLGQFLIFPFFASLFFCVSAWRKNHHQSVLFFVVAVLIAIALGFSENRASILGISIAIILFVFSALGASEASAKQLIRPKGEPIKSKAKKWIFAGFIIFSLVGFIFFLSPNLRSLGTRSVLWKDSFKLISQFTPSQFAVGTGLETYYHAIQETLSPDIYLYERMTDIPDRSHNALLDAFIMRGAFGFLLAALNIIFLIYLFVKKKITPASAPTGTFLRISYFSIVAYTISAQFGFSLTSQIIFLLAVWAILLSGIFKFKSIKIASKFSAKILISILLAFLALFYLMNI